jgi:subtilase family serine protease
MLTKRWAPGSRSRRLCTLSLAVTVALGLAAAAAAPSAVAATAGTRAVAGHIVPEVGVHPAVIEEGKAGSTTFSCEAIDAPVRCYTPLQLEQAYGWDSFDNRGAGETVVIIDAFQSPTLRQDLKVEDTTFGLPAPQLTILAPEGLTAFNPKNPDMVGWSAEISLDVESVHDYVPDAKIALVLAKTDSDRYIYQAQTFAVDHNLGAVISQSFGGAERCEPASMLSATHVLFLKAAKEGISVFASSGDTGAAQENCAGTGVVLAASWPASDPDVTGVGGTNVFLTASGARIGETAWDDGYGESGGGFSSLYKAPSYQTSLGATFRAVPDVSYNAGVNGGVLITWGSSGQGPGLLFTFGGTSAASPAWASIAALADQRAGRRLGFLNPAIYAIGESSSYRSDFNDITIGNNIESVGGYHTGPGYDPVTGWGTPRLASLIAALARPLPLPAGT